MVGWTTGKVDNVSILEDTFPRPTIENSRCLTLEFTMDGIGGLKQNLTKSLRGVKDFYLVYG